MSVNSPTYVPLDPLDGVRCVLAQLTFAREYTLATLADFTDDEWYTVPPGVTTHLAWQVGHIAMAEYGLCLFRVRGRQSEDLKLMPSKFRKMFSRGSTPDPNRDAQPSREEMLETVARIHQQVLLEAPTFTADQLNQPSEMPYAGPPTALGAMLFCPIHEGIHQGQIGLLRRLFGKPPLR
jgi:hypothetical protein